jgi:hypothetical protein
VIFLILPALPEVFKLAPLALDLLLIAVDRLILLRRLVIPALELIADQSTGTETQRGTDGSACARMADGRTDDTTCGCTTESADARALFPRSQRAARTPNYQRARQTDNSDDACKPRFSIGREFHSFGLLTHLDGEVPCLFTRSACKIAPQDQPFRS